MNTRKLMLGVMVLALLLSAVMPTLAQEPTSFESSTGLMTLDYPDNWYINGEFAEDAGLIVISNIEDILNLGDITEADPGTFVMTISLFTPEVLAATGIDNAESLSPITLTEAILANVLAPSESDATAAQVSFGEIETLALETDRELGFVTTSNAENEISGLYAVFAVNEVVIIVTADVYRADFGEYESEVFGILDSFTFNGSVDDLTP